MLESWDFRVFWLTATIWAVDVRRRSSVLLVSARAREIDQDPAHELCANGKKVSAFLPFRPAEYLSTEDMFHE